MNSGRRFAISLIAPALPPLVDGIGDYAARLAGALCRSSEICVFTTSAEPCSPIPGVRIIPAFDPKRRKTVRNLREVVSEHRPDWVILQFNQFSYGKWGLNP